VRLPDHHHQLFTDLTAKSISSHHLSSDSIMKQRHISGLNERPKSYVDASKNASHPESCNNQIDSLMHQISNEVFIGMVTMQYQACPDFVQMVEKLESG
jgi:hypothetical protein